MSRTLPCSKYSRSRSACGAGTGGAGGYGAWLVSKKLLKYGEFTGSDDVWGEGSGNSCLAKWQKVSEMGFRRPLFVWKEGVVRKGRVRTVHTLRADSKFGMIHK